MGKLLFDSEPLLIPKELAVKIGLNESIVLQQLHYWIEINRKARINNYDGYVWTFNTIEKWKEQFPFWSERTLKRVFKSLKNQNLIITGNYNKKNYDRTLWYTINYEQVEKLEKEPLNHCNISLGQNGTIHSDNLSPSLGQNGTMDKDKMTLPIPKTNKKITTKTTQISSSSEDDKEPIINFFKAIKGDINIIEKIQLTKVINEYPQELIVKAMEVAAVKAEHFNLDYVKSCLSDWEKQKVETVAEVDKLLSKPSYAKNKGNQTSAFNNFKQRDYDFKDLEKKLLGWDSED